MESLEVVTADNFNAKRYLLANPDLQKSGVISDDQLAEHLIATGFRENRFQVSRDLIGESDYRKDKFRRFRHVLAENPADCSSFPLFLTSAHYSQSEYQAESANADCGDFLAEAISHPENVYLDLGSGFRRTVLPNVLYLEVYPSLTADIIVSPNPPYPIKDSVFDGIVCADVLEHVRRPWEIVAEIHRMLKPGGVVFIDWPFLQPVHGFPSHYFNVTREGLVAVFEDHGFSVAAAETRDHQAPDHTIKWILQSLVSALPNDLRKKVSAASVGELMKCPENTGIWREILNAIPDATRSELACGNLLIGTKRT